ncbi:MAG: OsmC family protein [Chitinophagaceae bacterium]|nr:OsmC family protein [Chitinophagaceae bacterium]MEA3424842.1 OsmC family protein [Bacteroidota bacterium]MCA6454361.1 OsmC family protein [Chitinophagaceae bacterium]MCA6455620.1 OsmC family protein [Chitinophagaceae bacterium]MCA6458460.1 OsmC family protein [Chitinophagaceae bacterium]
MDKVSSSIKTDLYKIEIQSPSGNLLIADEPMDKGGKDLGFSPKELLIAALAACTSATLRMYADRKQWDLQEVKIDLDLDRNDSENKTYINRKIRLIGNLDEEQRARLLDIANKCPIHKILSNPIGIHTELLPLS